jgi:hypothetical protein
MAGTTKPSIDPSLSGQALQEQIAKEEAKVKESEAQIKETEAQTSKVTTPPAATEPEPSNPTTDNSGYKLTKNNLTLNGEAYTGEYNGKYYNQGKVETDAQVKADFLSKYKEQATFIASIPELGGSGINGQPSLLDQAIKGNWSNDQWIAAFTNTDWAKAHPGNIGLAEIQRLSTPSLYNNRYNAVQLRLAKLAASTGLTFTPGQLGQQIDPNGPAPTVDQTAIQNGQDLVNWVLQQTDPTDRNGQSISDDEIIQRMAQYGKIDPSSPAGGQVFKNAQALQQTANNYGTNGFYTQNQLNNYGQQILQGTYDPNTFEAQQKQLAMQLYKPFADQIAAGANVAQLATPYVNTLTNLLEIDPSKIDLGSLSDPYSSLITKAMMGDGQTATNPYDFAAQVRSRPEWLNTQNAHQTIMGGVDQLLSAFNFKGA